MKKAIADMKIYSIEAESKQMLVDIVKKVKKNFDFLLTPENERTLVEMEDASDLSNGFVKVDTHGNCIPVKYDALRVNFGEEFVLVKVWKAYSEILVDDNDEPIVLKEFGEDYLAESVVYIFGKVVESNVRYPKFYGNYMDDVVVREDEEGNRYVKTEDGREYGPCPQDNKEAFGGESFGYFHVLDEITEEQFLTFGKNWRY